MLTQDEFAEAMRLEIDSAGSQAALAEKLGMTQSQISDYVRGRFQIKDITIGTLYRLFPNTIINLQGLSVAKEPIAKNLEEQLLEIYHGLTPEQKVKCFAMVAANFGEKIREETKK